MEQPAEIFKKLFDFSFTQLITPQIIKILYGLGVFIAAIVGLSVFFTNFFNLFYIILGPIVFIVITAFFRVQLEIAAVIFQNAEGNNVDSVDSVDEQNL